LAGLAIFAAIRTGRDIIENEIVFPLEPARESRKAKVLLVDDDEGNALLSLIILERLGYQVQVCYNGKDAAAVYRESSQDFLFVVSDYSMSPINGLELAKWLLEINPRAVILVITGYDHPALMREAECIGVHLVSPKPSTMEEFVEMLQQAGL
jgi:DNA-binding NtrC family response regulator